MSMTLSVPGVVAPGATDEEIKPDSAPAAERRASSRRTMNARVGGRSERVVRDIMRSTIEELQRVPYAALRVEDVAARAGVNKTTIYRRWPTKFDLVAGALAAVAGDREPLPETGSFRSDLLALLTHTIAFVQTPEGRAVAKLVDGARLDPEVARLTRSLRGAVARRRATVLEHAQQRGEVPLDVDGALLFDAIFTPIVMRIVRYGETVDDATMVSMIDLVLKGAENGGGRSAPSAAASGERVSDQAQ